MRNVAVITGSRSEYGLLKPLLDELSRSGTIRMQLIVTGTHLLRRYGYTKNQITGDGFRPAAVVRMYRAGDDLESPGNALGTGIRNLTRTLHELRSDLVVILGDRPEAFAGSIAAVCLNIPVAHLSGGEVTESGHIDEQIRHAITKMAHIHFPATKESGQRIIKMGEEPWRVHVVGDPGISAIKKMDLPSREDVCNTLGFDAKKPLILCIQHPVSQQADKAGLQMRETLGALKRLHYQTVLVYPNGDKGSRAIIDRIEAEKKTPFFRIFRNLPREQYLGIMKNCDVMIGNSSSGISEAPSFGIRVINIGIREKNRENAGNIVHVDHDRDAITRAVKQSLEQKDNTGHVYRNPYEGSDPARDITSVLEHIDINKRLMVKKMMY
jgi:UDP-N-acetylglucosamine 2-epimerase (non-hydrolysing)/GDP/UDP-N,N'-diacetylbacillosamine 2-epimerase (hydrolysing)